MLMSLKCPQCGLVSFATAESCKRCGTVLVKPESEQPNSDQGEQAQNPQSQNTGTLTPCPDCAHLCSRSAEACSNCGRLLLKAKRRSLKQIVIVASVALICGSVVLGYLVLVGLRKVAVQAAVDSGHPENAGVSSRNREAARAALNAIGEIQSVTSVGVNFMQYTAAIQSAKIKFDAAMRYYGPHDPSDQQIRSELGEAFDCYVDAQDAWSEFIKSGEGHFIYDSDIVIKPLAGEI